MAPDLRQAVASHNTEAVASCIADHEKTGSTTAQWLEVVGTQYMIRDAFVTQKAVLAQLGSPKHMANESVEQKIAVFKSSFDISLTLVGPTELPSSATLQLAAARRNRIQRLKRQSGSALVHRLEQMASRPASSVPQVDELVHMTRVNRDNFIALLGQASLSGNQTKPLLNFKTALFRSNRLLDALTLGIMDVAIE